MNCTPESLNLYSDDVVVWAVPYRGMEAAVVDTKSENIQAYLDSGGKLFITGQNIAYSLSFPGGAAFLNNYLHASYVQDDTGLYDLSGTAGDPIGNGLLLNISGGSGANDQYSKDEVDPVGGA